MAAPMAQTPALSMETARSVPEMLLARIAATPDAEAYQFWDGATWKSLTWKAFGERVRAIACGLRALGLADEQRGAILAATRIEWIFADLSILCAGGATTTVYPSNTPDETAYIVSDSGSVVVFAENDEQVAKLKEKKGQIPAVKNVVTFDGKGDGGWVITLAELEEKGRAWDKANPGRFEQICRNVRPEALATLIYTSGTTGRPKGVELTHDTWVYQGWVMEKLNLLSMQDRQLLWLPLAHVFGKVLESGQIRIGFPTTVDGRVDKIVENMGQVKPTFVAAVPRIFEKAYNKILAGAKAGGGAKWAIFRWAIGVGRKVSALKQQGLQPGGLLALQHSIADKLALSKVRERFGGKLRFFISGSAPLSREMSEFFHACGLLVLEGYGMTESSAATTVNRPDRFKFGTVGPVVPGTEIKIAPEDGEILIKGRGVMRGYHGLPDATKETLTSDGWLKTGDIGEVTSDGLLRITDRKKDLIKTSGGKYVAPQSIEGKLKAVCPFVSQALVHGNNRNFCVALITVDEETIKKWARENGMGEKSYKELTQDAKVAALLQPFIDQLNGGLGSWEQIKKFSVLPADLTIEAGELTPSMKIKRKVVESKYKDQLDAFYAGSMAGM